MRKLINLLIVQMLLIFAMNKVSAQVQQAWVARYNGSENQMDEATALTVDGSGNAYVTGTHNHSLGFTIKYNANGSTVWGHGISGLEYASYPKDIAVDNFGNVYITGYTYIRVEDCQWDCFVVKYTSSGVEQWVRRYSGGSKFFTTGKKIRVDLTGNVYLTGVTGPESPCAEDVGAVSEYFTLKYNTSGDLQWVRQYNGTSPGSGVNNPYDMAVDLDGNVYVTGESQLNGYIDFATLKYNTNGDIQWTQRYTGDPTGDDSPRGIAIDGSGNVYVAGTRSSSAPGGDYATIKYNSAGVEQWVAIYNGTNYDFATDISLDVSGNAYVTGRTGNTSQDENYLTLKYSTAGTLQWAQTYNGTGSSEDVAHAIAVDIFGNAYVTGHSLGTSSVFDYATVKYNPAGGQEWVKRYNGPANSWDRAVDISVSDANNVYVTGVSNGTGTQEDYATIKYTQCAISCPADISVNNDAGQCGAIVNYASATTTGDCGSQLAYSKPSGTLFDIGTTTVTVTSTATGATCSFNVTVADNELPVLDCKGDRTVNTDPNVCYASAATVNAGNATATDNCNVTVSSARSDGLSLSTNYPVGITTIKWTATDANGNTSTCGQVITVIDNVPPTITGEAASTYVLSPPNHTMGDVTIDYTATDNCAVTTTISVSSNEPINGVGDGDTDPDWIIVDNHHVKLRAERSAGGNGRIYTITITAVDPSGNTTTKTIDVRVPHDIKKPNSGQAFIVGSTVNFEGEFWDKAGNRHTAQWLLDNTTTKATVTEPAGNKNGRVIGSYKITAPGVYKLQMNITDQTGLTTYTNTAGDLEAIVVIFDPNGGNAYGGGYFNSPAGALRSNPNATGKASYGFAMNYFKNSTYPKGETQFEFKVGEFEFNALNFEYLVISNSMAQFKGTGKIIGGQSGVGFIMTVTDGQLDGTGIDKIRMKIYNKNNGSIIYDNQPGASDAALPTQAVGANSIIVISGTNASLTSANTSQKGEAESKVVEILNGLDVIAFPNPTTSNFTITVKGNSTNDKIIMQVTDVYGRLIETRNVNPEPWLRR